MDFAFVQLNNNNLDKEIKFIKGHIWKLYLHCKLKDKYTLACNPIGFWERP